VRNWEASRRKVELKEVGNIRETNKPQQATIEMKVRKDSHADALIREFINSSEGLKEETS
jgi:hypothetical protein